MVALVSTSTTSLNVATVIGEENGLKLSVMASSFMIFFAVAVLPGNAKP